MAQHGVNAQVRRWHLLADADAVVAEVLARLTALAAATLERQERFVMVLAGGTTPARLYRQLATLDTDWSRWWILFGDERCLPVGDAERNDVMARREWLDSVAIPPAQILAMPAELGAEEGARRYSERLAGWGRFDLVLLGVGEDGHTASLFPGQTAGLSDHGDRAPVDAALPAAVPVTGSPKPPPQRVSLSAPRLADAAVVWFLATGAGKREALQRWHRGEPLPVAAIAPAAGVDIFTDCDPSAS